MERQKDDDYQDREDAEQLRFHGTNVLPLGGEGKLARLSTATIKAAQKYGPSVDAIARQYGVSGAALLAKLVEGESGDNPNAVSPAGARGRTQFMPQSRQDVIAKYGVDPWSKNPDEAVHAAALHLRGLVNGSKGLAGYNPGDPSYTGYILGQKVGDVAHYGGGQAPAARPAAQLSTASTTITPGIDNSGERRALVANFLAQGGVKNPVAVGALAAQYGQAADVPSTSTTTYNGKPQSQPKVKASAGSGAQAALSWAQSKIGFKETGKNSGGLASYANSRFGMSNQPWCAMFTSLAVTKGGAPKTARTASVAEVRRQAEQGGGGYQKGFVSASRAKAGDLILFGNDHIGMVKSVKDGQITFVGGNQSDGVTVETTRAGSGDIVRPKYGARK